MSILCLVALKRRLWLLPILTSGWLFSSFWTSYAITVSYNHTDADFPYIRPKFNEYHIGAGFAFGLRTVYCWFQTTLTYQVRYRFNKKKFVLLFVQFINILTMTMLLVLFSTTKAIYKVQKRQGKGTKLDDLRGFHLTSTITQWLLALSILTFTLTYAPEFKNMRVNDPNIYFDKTFEKKHSSVNLQKMADNNSNIPRSDVKNLAEGRADEDNHVTKGPAVVSNGTT